MTKHFTFYPFTSEDILNRTSTRLGEIRLGETVCTDPKSSIIRFVILGIEESVGPQANLGFGGAEHAFNSFLGRFLNMQSNEFCSGESIHILGKISCTASFNDPEDARALIPELDHLVENTLDPFIQKGIIPIVIGGGHNNAYPLIKSISKAVNQKITVINLDPHADCRALEGRHSGNPFSYAFEDGFLNNYAVLGLHKAYNNQFTLDYLRQKKSYFTFFESYLADEQRFLKDIDFVQREFSNAPATGIELDLDSIAFMPTSAFTPSGLSLNQARYYVRCMAKLPNARYLHLPEAAPSGDAEAKITGKALAYLTWDFISERISEK